MKDIIKVNDIVCYVTGGKIEVGIVSRVLVGRAEYIISPLNHSMVKRRKAKDLLTFSRLKKLTENSKFVK